MFAGVKNQEILLLAGLNAMAIKELASAIKPYQPITDSRLRSLQVPAADGRNSIFFWKRINVSSSQLYFISAVAFHLF